MRIKFTRDYAVKAEGGEKYAAGQEVEVSEASARHFINRRAAEEVKDKPPAKAAAKTDPKTEAEPTKK